MRGHFLRAASANVLGDADALAYIAAVEAADGQALESGVRDAINEFVVGCKSDGIWNAIKASCILAGARTLAGALVPLVGTAPTNNNFASGDYNRKTGIKGKSNASLDSNRLANEDSITSMHMAVYASEFAQSAGNTYPAIIGGDYSVHAIGQRNDSNQLFFRISSASNRSDIGSNSAIGLIGASRTNTASLTARLQGNNFTLTSSTSSHPSSAVRVFQVATASFTENRLSFYSLGEAINLAQLDSRVSTLMTAYAAAIP